YTDVINLGASDFITKPFNLNELEAKLNRLIRERTLRMELEKLCIHDCLTSLYNRRHLDYQLKFEAVRALRQHHNLYLIFIDVDNFKQYNDTKGHHAGDVVLEKIGRVLKKSIRENVDSAFRYGGDEFVVLIPYATEKQALMVAKRIQNNFYDLGLEIVTLSIGVAKLKNDPAHPEECMHELLKNADRAAYRAKNELGGNKVVIHNAASISEE
ncbi:MAG: diguanylate cyclase response regulator, partial [Deltaproteobacteria bacterium]